MLELGCFIGLLSPPEPWRRMGSRYKNVRFRMCRFCHPTFLPALLTFSSLSLNPFLTPSTLRSPRLLQNHIHTLPRFGRGFSPSYIPTSSKSALVLCGLSGLGVSNLFPNQKLKIQHSKSSSTPSLPSSFFPPWRNEVCQNYTQENFPFH